MLLYVNTDGTRQKPLGLYSSIQLPQYLKKELEE